MGGKWLSTCCNAAGAVVESATGCLQPSDRGDNENGGGDGTPSRMERLYEAGTRIEASARGTVEICQSTNEKRQQMISFANEIQSTLSSLKNGQQDASVLDTIKELTAGEKVLAAKEMAQGLDQAALECAEKSVEMITAMDDAMDCLPPLVQSALEKAAGDSDDVNEKDFKNTGVDASLLKDLDRDIDSVKTCITEISNLNLATGLRVGLQAFEQLADKAKRSKSMFDGIQQFASDVLQLSQAISNRNVRSIRGKSKDFLRCVRMTDIMKQLAKGAEKLMKVLIDLFQVTAERISTLWSSLDFAKNCMKDCLAIVQDAKASCLDAKDKSTSLIAKSRSVKEQLQAIGTINMDSVHAMRSLTNGDEIRDAIDLAQNMDTRVMECSNKVVSMVDRVQEGFADIPDILTDDIQPATDGKRSTDPEVNEIEDDIVELEACREAIERSSVLTAGKAGVAGFAGVASKAEMCQQMLQLMDGFASDCLETIQSFMGVWDLESATDKIGEMCRLVSLGELMKQFADKVKRLAVAIIALLQTAITKFKSLDIKSLTNPANAVENISQALGSTVEDSVEVAMDALKDKLNFSSFLK